MTGNTETMLDRRWFRVALAALLIVHGVIHIIAPMVLWGLAEFEDIDGEPTVAMSTTSADVLGAVWIVVLAAFVAAGMAVLARQGWWVPVALVSAVVSQLLIVLWWEGAWRGTIANVLIVAAVCLKLRRPDKRGA